MYIVIGGGGVMGQSLAAKLVADRHDVVVIEEDMRICENVSSRIGALAIHGNATNIYTLEEAGIKKAEVAVAAMPKDAENLAFSLLARNYDVPRVMARMRDPRYEAAYKTAGASTAISLSRLFVSHLLLEIEHPSVRQVATFGAGKASIVVVRIPDGATVDCKTIEDIAKHREFPEDCVIAGIYREVDEEFKVPRGNVALHAGDQVFLAASVKSMRRASDFLQKQK